MVAFVLGIKLHLAPESAVLRPAEPPRSGWPEDSSRPIIAVVLATIVIVISFIQRLLLPMTVAHLLPRTIIMQVKNLDQYGRNVAACSISPDLPFQQPEDVGTFLVSNGYAVAYR